MFISIISFPVYILLHYYVCKSLSSDLGLEKTARITLFILFGIFASLIFLGEKAGNEILLLVSNLWMVALSLQFITNFLSGSLTVLYPNKKSLWTGISIAFTFLLTLFVLNIGFEPFPYSRLGEALLASLFLFGVYFLVYRGLSSVLDLADKGKAKLIVVLWAWFLVTNVLLRGQMLIILFALLFFVFRRISTGLSLKRTGNIVLALFLGVVTVLSLPQMTFSGDVWNNILVYSIGGVCMGFLTIAFTVMLVEMGISWFSPSTKIYQVLFSIFLIVILTSYSAVNGFRDPVIREFDIPVKDLPKELAGFSIVQLSDLHVGELLRAEWLQNVVNRVNSLDPDVVVFTGDLFDSSYENGEEIINLFKKFKSRNGLFAVIGNHEFYSGIPRFLEFSSKAGLTVLQNSSVKIAGTIQIVGVNDRAAENTEYGGTDIEKAFADINRENPVIFLAHRPENFGEAVGYGTDLQLSGHTHAGQIPPLDIITFIFNRYNYGLYESEGAYIYTSCGTGVWGLRMRLFSKSEIVKFTLIQSGQPSGIN